MAKVTYIEFNGTVHVADVDLGMSLMQGAITNQVPGIEADCGGAATCGTCHCYIDQEWADKAGTITEIEKSMLEFVPDATSNSRLSCQIQVTEKIDGIVVQMPKSQH
jgi:2Fe-2S ferredoxin